MRSPLPVLLGCLACSLLNSFAHPNHEKEDGQVAPIAAGLPESRVSIRVEGDKRIIESNGIPDHETGQFPGRGNPSRITEQTDVFVVPANPVPAAHPMPSTHLRIGVALNGVPYDPVTAEFWQGNPEWKYEAIVGEKRLLGLDENNAHVQPDGSYHYHGIPVGLIKRLKSERKMTLIGWAADGFPIYGPFAHKDAKDPASEVVEMRSSYQLKQGMRPRPPQGPGGRYDGSFGADFEFVEGSGDLDSCNGRFGVAPEFPAGTYYYVLTNTFPYIPRLFRGQPDPSFLHHPPAGGGHPRGGRPPRPGRS